MARSKNPPAKKTSRRKSPTNHYDLVLGVLGALVDFVGRIVDRFGWPGATVILGYVFVERHASPEQKKEIIDLFLLGKGMPQTYVPAVIVGVGILLLLAQHVFWRNRTRVLTEEVDRLSEWKSAHQEATIGTNLHHSSPAKEVKP